MIAATYLQSFIKELYEVEPAVFSKLNAAQKKIFIRLFYMKTWAQVLNETEARHKYLKEKLESARDDLAGKKTADEVVETVVNNTVAATDVR